MAKHNKKRNVGLIHEQLIRFISERIVNQDRDAANKGIAILEKHFKKGSELYREFRLFNSLVHTRVDEVSLSKRIVAESKNACVGHDATKLSSEKSSLIRDINHNLNSENFYDQFISEYRIFATVQALLNEWRGNSKLFPEEVVEYEIVLENWLTRPKSIVTESKKTDPLVLSLMIEKFNKKYDEKLSPRQRNLIASKLVLDDEKVVECIGNIKKESLLAVEKFYESCDNDFLLSKKNLVVERINKLEITSDDATVERALALSMLIEELESSDE